MYKSKYHWGCFLWGYLHTITIFEKEKITIEEFERIKRILLDFKYIIPCDECKDEYSSFLKLLKFIKYEDIMLDRMKLFKWSVIIHNKANKKLGKKYIAYPEALKLWTKKE